MAVVLVIVVIECLFAWDGCHYRTTELIPLVIEHTII